MEKVAILTDSVSYLTDELKSLDHVEVVDIYINLENDTYKESEITNEEIFGKILNDDFPKTSQPTPIDFEEAYEKLIKKGYKKIFATHLLHKISGTVQGSYNVANEMMEKYPDVEIKVFDHGIVAQAGLIVVEIVNEVANVAQKTDDLNKLEDIATKLLEEVIIYVKIPTLDYLSRGGRVPSSVSSLASAINLVPVITLKPGKGITPITAKRGEKAALKTIMKKFQQEIENPSDWKGVLVHSNTNVEDASEFENMVMETLPGLDIKHKSNLGPVIACYTGPDTIGLGAYNIKLLNELIDQI